MKCKKWKYLLPDHAAGRLPESEAGEFDTHLLSCESCREEESRFRALFASIDAVSLAPPSQTEMNNFLVHVHEKMDRRRAGFVSTPLFLRLALPGIVAVVLCAAAFFTWRTLEASSFDASIGDDLRHMMSQLDTSQLATIEIPASVESSLPDIASPTALDTELSEALDAHVTKQMFADISDSELADAGGEYAFPSESSPFYDSNSALTVLQDISSRTTK